MNRISFYRLHRQSIATLTALFMLGTRLAAGELAAPGLPTVGIAENSPNAILQSPASLGYIKKPLIGIATGTLFQNTLSEVAPYAVIPLGPRFSAGAALQVLTAENIMQTDETGSLQGSGVFAARKLSLAGSLALDRLLNELQAGMVIGVSTTRFDEERAITLSADGGLAFRISRFRFALASENLILSQSWKNQPEGGLSLNDAAVTAGGSARFQIIPTALSAELFAGVRVGGFVMASAGASLELFSRLVLSGGVDVEDISMMGNTDLMIFYGGLSVLLPGTRSTRFEAGSALGRSGTEFRFSIGQELPAPDEAPREQQGEPDAH